MNNGDARRRCPHPTLSRKRERGVFAGCNGGLVRAYAPPVSCGAADETGGTLAGAVRDERPQGDRRPAGIRLHQLQKDYAARIDELSQRMDRLVRFCRDQTKAQLRRGQSITPPGTRQAARLIVAGRQRCRNGQKRKRDLFPTWTPGSRSSIRPRSLSKARASRSSARRAGRHTSPAMASFKGERLPTTACGGFSAFLADISVAP